MGQDGVIPEIDTSKPHPARVYDFLLGGKDNFAADRMVAERLAQAWPGVRQAARENRAFIRRAVRYLVEEEGVTQFLDIGSGLPTVGNVHEVAQAIDPAVRVVYVDNDRCKSGCTHAFDAVKAVERTRKRKGSSDAEESAEHGAVVSACICVTPARAPAFGRVRSDVGSLTDVCP